ncbi:MAG: hypothetical protein QNL04_13000, partial [SAR324 cluster bacterium]|nr:hypothetical protein [SAR324 cluster bacterium]
MEAVYLILACSTISALFALFKTKGIISIPVDAGADSVEEGKRLKESLVKQLTGGDAVSARFLFKDFFKFYPECKIFFVTNHKPVVR